MARVHLTLPHRYSFSAQLPVRITDVNYGNHLGNDALLSLLHEARVQYLQHLGYSELNLAGVGLIMADVVIVFKAEAFYGDILTINMAAQDFSRVGFDLVYQLTKTAGGTVVVVAEAKTGMVCFDYEKKKVVSLPIAAKERLEAKFSA